MGGSRGKMHVCVCVEGGVGQKFKDLWKMTDLGPFFPGGVSGANAPMPPLVSPLPESVI